MGFPLPCASHPSFFSSQNGFFISISRNNFQLRGFIALNKRRKEYQTVNDLHMWRVSWRQCTHVYYISLQVSKREITQFILQTCLLSSLNYVFNICLGTCYWVEFYCTVIYLYVIFLTLNNCERYWTDINFFMFDFN